MAAIRINPNEYLGIDFRYKNRRHVFSTGLTDTTPNRRKALNNAKAIEYSIKNGTLELDKYFPQIKAPLSRGTLIPNFTHNDGSTFENSLLKNSKMVTI